MDTREIASEYRLAYWEQRLRERNYNGQSVREYCASTGIHKNTFYYWQRKLREAASTAIAEREPERQMTPNGWKQLVPAAPRAENTMTVEINGCRVTVNSETDAELLVQVCRVLKTL